MGMTALFDSGTLLTYLAASFALVLAPGPGQALVIARSVEGGARAGLLTAVGLEIGTLIHTFAAAVGISAILATSATAFSIVKYAGAAYLVVLGVLTLRHSRRTRGTNDQIPTAAPVGRRLLMHAAFTGLLNPKVAVFFLAFLPQFVRPERGAVILQFLVLGIILALLGLLFDACVAVATGRARGRLLSSPSFASWRERVTGTVLIALGLRLAVSDRR
jgi:threonine/homoserine/homoserine lactone efflux protein